MRTVRGRGRLDPVDNGAGGGSVGFALLAPLLLAVAVVGALEASMRVPLGRVVMLPGPMLVGLVVVWSVVTGLFALFGSFRWVAVAVLACTAVLASVNVVRMRTLGVPLMPSDAAFLGRPGFLAEMVPVRTLTLTGLGAVVLVVLLVLGARRLRVRDRWPSGRGTFAARLTRVTAGAVAVLVVVSVARFNAGASPLRDAYEASGASWKPWSQPFNYEVNGFVGGVLYNMPTEAMPEPARYSADAVGAAVHRRPGRTATGTAGVEPNVVVILSESFADPRTLPGVTVAEDPFPALDRVAAGTARGTSVGKYGTGTSTMEFQVLTSMAAGLLAPQVASPYQQVLAGRERVPGWVRWFRDQGYRTVALHPYDRQMYRREAVYPAMGFESFLGEEDLPHVPWPLTGFVRDEVPLGVTVEEIERSEDPVFAHVVTMQNHLPYRDSDDPVGVQGVGAEAPVVGSWIRGLQETDRAVARFLEQLETVGEPTLVVHYGDHFPGIFGNEVLDRAAGAETRAPFFVWSNYADIGAQDLGVVGAHSLLPLALQLGGVGVPAFGDLALAVQEQVGALAAGQVVGRDGDLRPLSALRGEQRDVVGDLGLAQYDLLVGGGRSTRAWWGDPPAVAAR